MMMDARLCNCNRCKGPKIISYGSGVDLLDAGGGGAFPMHLDSDESVDSRRVSAIVYLNPEWKEGDGGELRLYPSWDKFLDIQPVNDRLVLFPSCRMPHRFSSPSLLHFELLDVTELHNRSTIA